MNVMFDIDPCPLCGAAVTEITKTPVYNTSILPLTTNSFYSPYTETVITVGPCGHEVDAQSEGNKVRLFAKQTADESPNGRYQQFLIYLHQLASVSGWVVYPTSTWPSTEITLKWACSHGQQFQTMTSWMQSTLAPLQLAQTCWTCVQKMCQCQTQYTYSTYIEAGYSTLQQMKIDWNTPWPSFTSENSILRQLGELCPGLRTVSRECPGCPSPSTTGPRALSIIIPHLNDTHKWSREKIADWLEVIMTDPDVDLTIKPKGKVNA